MNNRIHRSTPAFSLAVYYTFAFILFAGYIFVYQTAPFEVAINDTLLNLMITFASLFAAIVATVIFFHYHPEDRPRIVWLNLALGCWFWFLAEAIWTAIYFVLGVVPTPSAADVGWVIGFIFFTIAIYHQYILILPAWKNRIMIIAFGSWAFVLIVPWLVLSIMRIFTLEDCINYFYPLADLGIGIAGLMLVYFFRGGLLMRPWLGMVVFGISDFFYAWAEQTGVYTWSVENNNLLTLAIDSSYLAAYLILGLGFLSHWILINYGLRGNQK